MTDLLIRRDTPIPRGTKLAYRVVLDYTIELGDDGWLDPDEDSITLDDLEKRIVGNPRMEGYRTVLTALTAAGVKAEDNVGDMRWTPMSMDGQHTRPVMFETPYQAENRRRDVEYVVLDQPCCPTCGSFRGDECDTCEDGVPAAAEVAA
jgi:hypothetical protein